MSEEIQGAATEPAVGRKRSKALIVLALLAVTGLVAGGWWLVQNRIYIATDNAFVEAPLHTVSARVSGQVVKVLVNDNQHVQAGDLLVELDPRDYDLALRKAQALLEQARNQTSGEFIKVAEARAAVQQAEASLAQTQLDLKRGEVLHGREVIPREQLERLQTAVRLAAARLQQAEEGERRVAAEAGSGSGAAARIAQRQAEVEEAQTNLERTRLLAPAAGYVTRKTVEVGNNVRPGQALLSVVQLADPWVVANLKESQMAHIRVGQKVRIGFDALPGEECEGEVESIMAGTGAAFSLLPPENATGNYVKVVQRIPVKIRLQAGNSILDRVRVGMSANPVIDTGRTPGAVLADLNPFR